MLPLRRTISTFSISLLIFLTSCSDKSKSNIAVIKALEEGIQFSNKSIAQSSQEIIFSLKEKLYDPGTKEFASRWSPKSQKVQEASKSAFDFIEAIKTKIDKENTNSISNENISGLFDKLIEYKKDLLQIDSSITETFESRLIVVTRSFDSAGTNQNDLYQSFFKDASINIGKALLSHIQNNILINEEKIVTFCHEQIATHPLLYIPSPLLTQSSSIVSPNELIEITAGIACFDKTSKPEVSVYDSRLPLSSTGVAHYEFKAAPKSGKYSIPLKITYIDYDGTRRTFQKEIEYTVANIQKQ